MTLTSSTLTPQGILNAGIQTDVWIAVRTDGQPGSGTKDDPLGPVNGLFDLVFAGLPSGTRANLLPGVYPVSDSWFLKNPNVKIVGAGRHLTTLRLTTFNPSLPKHTVMQSYGNVDYTEVSDLTLDGNYPGLSAQKGWVPHQAVCGAQVYGNHVRFENVDGINLYGDMNIPGSMNLESFGILLGNQNPGVAANCVDCTARGCRVYSLYGNYTNGFTFSDGALGLCEDCYVDGATHGCGFGDWIGGRLINFVTTNACTYAYYQENTVNDLLISGGSLKSNGNAVINFNNNAPNNNIRIVNNDLNCIFTGGNWNAICFTGTGGGTNIHVTGNQLTGVVASPYTGTLFSWNGVAGAQPTYFVILGNTHTGFPLVWPGQVFGTHDIVIDPTLIWYNGTPATNL